MTRPVYRPPRLVRRVMVTVLGLVASVVAVHAFGLPDSSHTDGTPMSASFYNYTNTHFNQSQNNAIRGGPYGSFLL